MESLNLYSDISVRKGGGNRRGAHVGQFSIEWGATRTEVFLSANFQLKEGSSKRGTCMSAAIQ